MSVTVRGQVGPQILQDGTEQGVRLGRTAEQIVSELHGRYYEQTYRGNVFSVGMSVTAINNATFTSATTGATATPILGVWNPQNSLVNLVLLQASLALVETALQATGTGPFVWMASVNNSAISTGIAPFNHKTLVAAGSQAKGFNASPALTGMVNALSVIESADISYATYNISLLGTAAGFMTVNEPSVQNFDGLLIVPPGAVLALMGTTTGVAQSAAGRLVWEEVLV